ncbi:fatty acid and retinol binding protein, partial [Aphelenchoides avenae]
MMLLFIVALLYSCTTTAHLDPRNLPPELQALVPHRIRSFYQNISDDESALVEKVLSDADYWKSTHNFLNVLSRNDSDAMLKILELHADLGHIWENLTGPAKDFAQNLEDTLIQLAKSEATKEDRERIRHVARAVVSKYGSLSKPARENFKENFREVAMAIE